MVSNSIIAMLKRTDNGTGNPIILTNNKKILKLIQLIQLT